MKKAMATHSSTLAWQIPWTEEPGGLQSMGSQRVGHEREIEQLHFHFSLSCIGEGNGNPLQCSCLENPRDGGAWWAAVSGVAQSQTRLSDLAAAAASSFLCVCLSLCFLHSSKEISHIGLPTLLLLLSRFSYVRFCATP